MRIANAFCLLAVTLVIASIPAASANAQVFPLWGGGDGVYFPNAEGTGGDYNGNGISTVLWLFKYDGKTQITGADESGLNLTWQNPGNGEGAPVEQFHTCRTYFGRLVLRVSGTTELMPIDANGNFTAVWKGRFEVVRGTGLFCRARGFANVVAENPPFNITDAEWPFTWYWYGRIRLW